MINILFIIALIFYIILSFICGLTTIAIIIDMTRKEPISKEEWKTGIKKRGW